MLLRSAPLKSQGQVTYPLCDSSPHPQDGTDKDSSNVILHFKGSYDATYETSETQRVSKIKLVLALGFLCVGQSPEHLSMYVNSSNPRRWKLLSSFASEEMEAQRG